MSAEQITTTAISALEEQIYSLIVINYANPDMVGHTGQMDATVKAIETVDLCLGKLLKSTQEADGILLITSDHGNAEYIRDEQGNPWTAHTNNPTPFIVVKGKGAQKISEPEFNIALRSNSCLADIAPTILELLKLPQPIEMTGSSTLKPNELNLLNHHKSNKIKHQLIVIG